MKVFFEKLLTISPILAVAIGVIMAFTSSLGDFFIKHATTKNSITSTVIFVLLGGIVYGLSAIGWYFVFRKVPLATIGIIDGVLPLIVLVVMGYFFFGEKMTNLHLLGVLLGILSILCFNDLF